MHTQPSESSHLASAQTLDDLIRSKRFQWFEAVELLAKIANVVHLHNPQGEIYAGLTPRQILVDELGVPRLIQTAPFSLDAKQQLDVARPLEDYAYWAPECLAHGGTLSVQANIYALGSILYQLLTDRVLFVAKTQEDWINQILDRLPRPPRTLDDRIPRQIEEVCLKCLEKNGAARYQSGAELAKELRNAAKVASAAEQDEVHEQENWLHKLRNFGLGWRLPAAVVLLLIVVSCFSVISVWYTGKGSQAGRPTTQSLSSPQAEVRVSDAASESKLSTPSISVVTDWKKFSTKSELDVVKGRTGEWVSMLQRPPKVLLFPTMLEQSSICYRALDREVFVSTTELVLLELGQIDEPDYDYKVTVGQNAWEGSIGVFVGYQDAQDMGPGFRHCHFVYLSRHDVGRDQLLGATLHGVFINEQNGLKSERNPILTPASLPAQEQVMLVEVRNRHFHALRWGEQSSHLPRFQRYYRATSYAGRFGLYFSKASGFLRDPQIRVISKSL